ncbi:MAG: DUF3833 family protein [Pseudomonadota bacterium]
MLDRVQDNSVQSSGDLFLPDFFEGETRAHGFFETVFGTPKRYFRADISGRWEGSRFRMDEDFLFDDGEQESRTWWLEVDPDAGANAIRAFCAETPEAGIGEHNGRICNLTYRFRLAVGDKSLMVRFRDLFVLAGDNTLLNRGKVSKWGLPVGQLVIAFRKV